MKAWFHIIRTRFIVPIDNWRLSWHNLIIDRYLSEIYQKLLKKFSYRFLWPSGRTYPDVPFLSFPFWGEGIKSVNEMNNCIAVSFDRKENLVTSWIYNHVDLRVARGFWRTDECCQVLLNSNIWSRQDGAILNLTFQLG